MMAAHKLSPYRCPRCRAGLDSAGDLLCPSCGSRYPVDLVPDFRLVSTAAGATDERMACCAHASEEEGTAWRAQNFYASQLAALGPLSSLQVLDDGCGNGRLVDELVDLGVDAWGIDPGYRTEQWEGRRALDRLSKGDGLALPFADGAFDAVVSSCVLPHVGEFTSDRAHQRARYLAEALRVLRPGGLLFLAHPNGACPVDFWHRGFHSIRPHRPYEAWMPNVGEVRRYLRRSGYETEVDLIQPDQFVSWLRVSGDRLGRLLLPLARANMWLLRRAPRLLGTPVNPMLVLRIRREG